MKRRNLPLTKTLNPEHDYVELADELKIVDRYFTTAREQHPHRRFEYAMALRAYSTWLDKHNAGELIYDVGGAGSPFPRLLRKEIGPTTVIDPDEPGSCTLDQFVRFGKLSQTVFCLSVLEHVDDLDQFLYHLACLVAPGGLLFLTMDCCESHVAEGVEDTFHFNWMRKRIFTPYSVQNLVWAYSLKPLGFELFGEADWVYHGPHVYDYSFMSLALLKRP